MSVAVQLAFGSMLTVTGWWLTRAVAGARLRSPSALWLDAALPLLVFGWLLAITSRPTLSGAATLALAGGFAFSDRRKRAMLAEPIVVSDVFLSCDIFRHPSLAVPFPDTARILSGAGLVVGGFVALLLIEAPAWNWAPWPLLIGLASLLFLVWAVAGPLNVWSSQALRRLQPSGDPAIDGARYGSIATLLIYGIVARAERVPRRALVAPAAICCGARKSQGVSAPIVVVQCESFFDVRRVHPSLRQCALPNLDRCRNQGLQWGHLAVPCWGANTVRTEFAVLTGLPEAAIGFDKFNPYQGFARAPVSSLAWQMRAQGYRTVCVHPFDRRFYGRDAVMGNLGFDEFVGEEAFAGGQRVGAFTADVEVARFVADLLRQRASKLFVFAITMENHGPWLADAGAHSTDVVADLSRELELPPTEHLAFTGFVAGVRNADAMLGVLANALNTDAPGGLMALYGDHLPSFPQTFRSLGFHDRRSDYLLWRAGSAGATVRRDLAAQDLMGVILEAQSRP
jgi:hypothetical protein